MELHQPFVQIDLRFDAARLREEVERFAVSDWQPHPEGHPGNWAIPLVSAGGDPRDEGVSGPMRATPLLARCDYVRQVMDALDVPIGRSRLMKLDAGAEGIPHVDLNIYWQKRVRVHVPVITSEAVRFVCGDAQMHMAAGDCWIFDTWRRHYVVNSGTRFRVHLVVDTVGSETFWRRVASPAALPQNVPFEPSRESVLRFESVNAPPVMNPAEIEGLWLRWISDALDANADEQAVAAAEAFFGPWLAAWKEAWALHGEAESGRSRYEALRQRLVSSAKALPRLALGNDALLGTMLWNALAPALLQSAPAAARATPSGRSTGAPAPAAPAIRAVRFERPLIIVAAPRSGSTLLFETLAQSPSVVTLGAEGHREIESVAGLSPSDHGFDSNRLGSADASPDAASEVLANFAAKLRDRLGKPPPDGARVRLLEKTPKNALRVPFLNELFPDALFVYLWRDPFESVGSLIDGWLSERFVMYPELPGWTGPPWSFLLVPGWRELAGAPLAAVCAAQWLAANQTLLADLAQLPAERRIGLSFAEFLAAPQMAALRISSFAGIAWDLELGNTLPLSRHTLSAPAPDKWRRHEAAIGPQAALLEACARRIASETAAWADEPRAPAPAARPWVRVVAGSAQPAANSAGESGPGAQAASALASVHTQSLAQILRRLGSTLLVSTYQAGQLIAARERGGGVNTHFMNILKPMGVAVAPDRIYVGSQHAIREYRNVPETTRRLEQPGEHDAVYVLRNVHVTGNVDIHEMAWVNGSCVYVNTAFSCLCVLDTEHSFVPLWRPRFVSAYSPEDRCHLNGMGLAEGRVRYLTALGASDAREGWRQNKRDGGVLLDYDSGEIIAAGLSMPHSPRWHRGRLWVLESGKGSLGVVDLASGRVDTVARLPGFTRGLTMVGDLAFIGISQLREKHAFTNIAITEELAERACGVWVVHLETGKVAAFLKFSDAVQEIFAVELIAGVRFPEFIDEGNDMLDRVFVLPDAALEAVKFTDAA